MSSCRLFFLLTWLASFHALSTVQGVLGAYKCPLKCTTNVFEKIYPNQNMCKLLHEVPPKLRNLPYGIYTNCTDYDYARFNYNKRFNIFPHAVFTPRNPQEVAYVLKTLRDENLDFSLRSGGHCFGPGSLAPGYVIDLRNFNQITPNVAKQEVIIGAGCRLGPVIEKLGALDYALPTGTCSSVGVTGLALGAGLGILSRSFGLTCESIKSMTFVNAKGNIVTVTPEKNPQLFWALCGAGGGSYGIVLDFTFKMHYLPRVSYLELTWPWDPSTVFEIFKAWQEWIPTLTDKINTEIHLKCLNGDPKISVVGLKIGSQPFTEWIQPFKKLKPHVDLKQERYINAARRLASNYVQPFAKARSKFLLKPLPQPGVRAIVNLFERLKKNKEKVLVTFEIGAARGKIGQVNETSYHPRNAFAWFFQFIYWNQQEQSREALDIINNFYETVEPYTSPYSYANLVDYELGKKYLRAYYGDNVDRLIRIKRAHDPENIFNWKQSIPLAR